MTNGAMRVKLTFAKPAGSSQVVADATTRRKSTVRLVRARVTSDEAWFDVELSGVRAGIGRLLNLFRRAGATILFPDQIAPLSIRRGSGRTLCGIPEDQLTAC